MAEELQRDWRYQRRVLTQAVQQFSVEHPVVQRVPFFFQPTGQPCPVEEVAKRLVGHYLCCRESNLVLRILETEAYQEGEQLYRWKFRDGGHNFRMEAGTLVQYNSTVFSQSGLVITTGDDTSGDVVFLRACEPIHGHEEILSRLGLSTGTPISPYRRTNLISGPSTAFEVLQPDLEMYSDLLDASRGIHLLQKGPVEQVTLQGRRVVPKDTPYTKYSTMAGVDRNFRFALGGVHQSYRQPRSLRRIIP